MIRRSCFWKRCLWGCVLTFVAMCHRQVFCLAGEELQSSEIATMVLEPDESGQALWERDVIRRLQGASDLSRKEWEGITTVGGWERFRAEKIHKLRTSLGWDDSQRKDVSVRIVREISGDGYTIRNVIFPGHQSDSLVTANLYVPAKRDGLKPGVILCHSHHAPKTEGELQEMGIQWSRAGCYVLVIDLLGHGERRQHPFIAANNYPQKFQVGRQDYFFRFNTSIHLYLAGESLMGWFVGDLMRGVDVLLSHQDVNPKQIILLGAVAGGGDPVGVAGALDPRINAVVPFNFGGPQPETHYPLPDDAEFSFDYIGGGSWESTRNLRHSASDGFLPWVVVGSIAPRHVIHAHEFAWDQSRDPVWKRYQKIFGFYQAAGNLDHAEGFGTIRQANPPGSHCNNIGRVHRQRIHAAFRNWFGVQVDEAQPVPGLPASQLRCFTPEEAERMPLALVRQLARQISEQRSRSFIQKISNLSEQEKVRVLQTEWEKLLGDCRPFDFIHEAVRHREVRKSIVVERVLLQGEAQIPLPLLTLKPLETKPLPAVVIVAQAGKAKLLKHRSVEIGQLAQRCAVYLVDVRGTGETAAGTSRGRRSQTTSLAASELMLGQTLLGSQLRDLRSVVRYLKSRPEHRGQKLAIVGESLAETNSKEADLGIPLDLDQPQLAEPAGGLLALLVRLFEPEDVAIVAVRGMLLDYRTIFDSPFIHVPFDAIVPGAANLGGLPQIALAISRTPLRMEQFVDGLNRPIPAVEVVQSYGAISKEWPRNEASASSNIASTYEWIQTQLFAID